MTFRDPDEENNKILLIAEFEHIRKGLEKDFQKLITMVEQYLAKNGTDMPRLNNNLVFSLVLHLKESNEFLEEMKDYVKTDNDVNTFVIPIKFENAIKRVTLKELRDMSFKGKIKE